MNRTLGNHWLRFGTVELNGFRNGAGGYSLRILGRGINTSQFRAGANQAAGPAEFLRQAGKMKKKLKETCGG